jgi:uncharacterized protein YdaT
MPKSMTALPQVREMDPVVRDKATAVAREFLARGIDERNAIRLAIAVAEAWAERRHANGSATR